MNQEDLVHVSNQSQTTTENSSVGSQEELVLVPNQAYGIPMNFNECYGTAIASSQGGIGQLHSGGGRR